MINTNTIWVICKDYGYEGLKEPSAAFADEATATAALELLGKGTDSWKLCEVPVWPAGLLVNT